MLDISSHAVALLAKLPRPALQFGFIEATAKRLKMHVHSIVLPGLTESATTVVTIHI